MRQILLIAPLILAACGSPAGHGNDQATAAAAAQFKPPPVQVPDPIPGQAHTNPITAYVGKYPNDAVDGVTFYDRTEVANMLVSAVPDARLRRLFTGRDATAVPIFMIGGRIAAHACEPHDCGNHNWTFFIKPDASAAMACHHDATMGDTSRWYAGGAPVTRSGTCPSA